MKRDINDFVTIIRQKNGNVKVTHTIQNEANIYKLLHELGFRKSNLKNKKIYYQRKGGTIIPTNFKDIKYAFLDILRKSEFTNIPEDLRYSEIVNWYHKRLPIKNNGLFDHYLFEDISQSEALTYCLLTDHIFKHKYEVQKLILRFEALKFGKTIDKSNSICQNAPLYFKEIEGNKYIIFAHYNSEVKTIDGFSCWIARYRNVKQIGIKKPVVLQLIKPNFYLANDYELVRDYVIL